VLTTRRVRHDLLSVSLAALDDEGLADLLATSPAGASGAGGATAVVDVDGIAVFAKRIPITERELEQPLSTANLFDLPMSCQYGMHPLPGPGFGAWRELAANIAVTDGVLAGETASFALLHHWRVLPGRPPIAPEHQDVDAVVAQFGGDRAVRHRFHELAEARSSLVLFLEHIPHPLLDELSKVPVGSAQTFERQLFDAVTFLRDREILHMDGHFGNMRSDGEQIYLVDFGLATSPRFDLSTVEHTFVAENVEHDAHYAAMRLVNWLVTAVGGVFATTPAGLAERNAYVRRCAQGDIPQDLPAVVADILARHAPAAARMNDFCWRLVDGDIDARHSSPPSHGPAAAGRISSYDRTGSGASPGAVGP
jgi:hypothetical protein